MPLIYSVVCRAVDAVVLAEVCDRDIKGSVGPVFLELLQHLRDTASMQDGDRMTFVQRNQDELDFFSHFIEACNAALGEAGDMESTYFFHLYLKGEVYYGCLGDDPELANQKVNFAFLDHLQKEFTKMHRMGRIRTANAYALDRNFSPSMRSGMHYHNIHQKDLRQEERITKLKTKVENIRTVMGRNINMVLERGEKLDDLYRKSEGMRQDVQVFKKKARKTKNIMRRKYYTTYVVLAILIALVVYIPTVVFCGLTLGRCIELNFGGNAGEGGNDNKNDGKDNGKRFFV